MSITSENSPPGGNQKLDFLRDPGSYPEPTHAVTVIETHHAWVFLTDTCAYKMKKPYRRGPTDYSTLESRRHLCEEEYRLNQRLAPKTYLAVLPLVVDEDGRLQLDGGGRPVEWLVKMRRLPSKHMLNNAGPAGLVHARDIDLLMQKLLDFYRTAPACRVGSGSYASRLQKEVARTGRELLDSPTGFSSGRVANVTDRLKAYIDAEEHLLERRQREGFVRELHGDLRPEHIYLAPDTEPEIIDRLEFDPHLRCLDCIEELAFFGLECRVIDLQWIERACIDHYRANSGDDAPPQLWRFYAARRAVVRAMLSAWRTIDTVAVGAWRRRAYKYLSLARDYLDDLSVG